MRILNIHLLNEFEINFSRSFCWEVHSPKCINMGGIRGSGECSLQTYIAPFTKCKGSSKKRARYICHCRNCISTNIWVKIAPNCSWDISIFKIFQGDLPHSGSSLNSDEVPRTPSGECYLTFLDELPQKIPGFAFNLSQENANSNRSGLFSLNSERPY